MLKIHYFVSISLLHELPIELFFIGGILVRIVNCSEISLSAIVGF